VNPAFTHRHTRTHAIALLHRFTHIVVYISCQIDYKGLSQMVLSVHIRNHVWFGFSSAHM